MRGAAAANAGARRRQQGLAEKPFVFAPEKKAHNSTPSRPLAASADGAFIPLGAFAVAAFLEPYGYAAVHDAAWKPVGEASRQWPQLELTVPGHEEVDGHTLYMVDCAVVVPSVSVNASDGSEQRLSWQASKRLIQLREDLHDRVKVGLGDAYKTHFGDAPFAQKGGLPGTTARLNAWCRALALSVNTGVASPAVAALVLHFFAAPEPELRKEGEFFDMAGGDAATKLCATLEDAPVPSAGSPAHRADRHVAASPPVFSGGAAAGASTIAVDGEEFSLDFDG